MLFTFAYEAAGAIGAPGFPCALCPFQGRDAHARLGRTLRCGNVELCVIDVIASEAKQSRIDSKKSGLLRRFAPLRKRFAFVAGNDDRLFDN
jgi:hypothetical protein